MSRLIKKSNNKFADFIEQVFNQEVKVKIQGQNVTGKIYDFNSNKDIVWVEATIDDGAYTDMWDMHLSKVTFVDHHLEDMKEEYLESKEKDVYASTKTAVELDEKDYKNPDDMIQDIKNQYDGANLQAYSDILNQYHQISEIYTALEVNDLLDDTDVFSKDMIADFEKGVQAFDSFGYKLQRKLDELSGVQVKR